MKLYYVKTHSILLPDGSTAMPGTVVGVDKLPASAEWLAGVLADGTISEVKGPEDLPPSTEPPPPPPTKVEEKWAYNPAALSNLGLDQLNAIIEEQRGDEPVEPAPTVEEAIAFLTQNFVPE